MSLYVVFVMGFTMEQSYMMDLATLFHSLLFAYQKSVKELLGSGSAIFVHPMIETLNNVERKRGLNLLKGKSLDEAYTNLSNFFLKTGVVKEFTFQKVDSEKYVLKVDGCIWASHIHEELKPKDVTCPYALLAMAVFEKVTGRKVKVTDSIYLQTGTETIIEALEPE
jgi:hypothetical protein